MRRECETCEVNGRENIKFTDITRLIDSTTIRTTTRTTGTSGSRGCSIRGSISGSVTTGGRKRDTVVGGDGVTAGGAPDRSHAPFAGAATA